MKASREWWYQYLMRVYIANLTMALGQSYECRLSTTKSRTENYKNHSSFIRITSSKLHVLQNSGMFNGACCTLILDSWLDLHCQSRATLWPICTVTCQMYSKLSPIRPQGSELRVEKLPNDPDNSCMLPMDSHSSTPAKTASWNAKQGLLHSVQR